jgi:hypothetical protein
MECLSNGVLISRLSVCQFSRHCLEFYPHCELRRRCLRNLPTVELYSLLDKAAAAFYHSTCTFFVSPEKRSW